jgi:trimethylamine--corrinoid protein Co-methyltransferase
MAQLARFYGLVPVANCGLTDALQPDFQAGCEKAMTAVFGSLAGLEKIGCQGIVGADQGFSFEQLVLDNEWIGAYNYILNGIEVTEETIAADLVQNVGIGGNFLAETHTVSHMRESHYASTLPNRQSWDSWLGSGGKDALAKARDFVETATAGYRTATPVCTEGELQELRRICADARRAQ